LCNGEPISKAQQSPERWPRAFACSAVGHSQGGRAQLCGRLIVFRSVGLWLWGGAAGAGTWGQVSSGTFHWVRGTSGGAVDGVCPLQENHARNIRDPSRVLEQGPDRQRAPRCCAGGVSSINGASESRCSHDGPGSGCQQGLQHFRHCSSPGATGVHEGGTTPIGRVHRQRAAWRPTGRMLLTAAPGPRRTRARTVPWAGPRWSIRASRAS
jgi:hypothetical protein